jgi:hypothetical protein
MFRYPENSTTYCRVAEAQSAAGRIAAVLPHEAAVDDGPLAAWTGWKTWEKTWRNEPRSQAKNIQKHRELTF